MSPRDRTGDAGVGGRRERDREERLGAIRREAAEAGRVAGEGVWPAGAPFPAAAARASAETGYYGQPLLKRPVWTWEVPVYFFTGGAAGAAAVIAAAARAAGAGPELARDARWIAALGGAASPALLVSDLGRPERFLNMLRVFKPGSAMSVGAWTLVAFSTASSARAFADLLERRNAGADRSPGRSPGRSAGGPRLPVRVLANAAEALSAATGTVMASYTGVLVGATVIPVWNRSVRVLPIHFAASGLASAVALLELLGHRHRALNFLGIAAAAVETAVGAVHETDPDPVYEPLKRGRSGAIVRTGGVLSGPVPLVLRLLGARRAAAVSALAGSLLTRFGWVEAGKVSADDPFLPLGLE
ncbi:MAG TPA: NrfD/PsrC family molybdoenzyme membrane anchor subunit [Thermoanaerobaculia bacterium]|nr:NrfD/PsrC family molybdoenzyme membrane anchor subunit [Thermoanaerobaculia bacterium]